MWTGRNEGQGSGRENTELYATRDGTLDSSTGPYPRNPRLTALLLANTARLVVRVRRQHRLAPQ